MAAVIYLVRRISPTADNNRRDSVEAVLITVDNAVQTSDDLIRQYTRDALNAAGFNLPEGYFHSTNLIADAVLLGQSYDTPGNYLVFTGITHEETGFFNRLTESGNQRITEDGSLRVTD